MNTQLLYLSAIALPLALGNPLQNASAALIAYEGYDYAGGTDLSSQTGGTGWSAAWTATTGDTAQSGSLGYTDSLGNMLLTSGNSAVYNGVDGTSQSFRDLPSVLGADNTTTWVSFVGMRGGMKLGDPPNFQRGVNFSLFNSAIATSQEQLAIGEGSNQPFDTWGLVPDGSGGNTVPSTVPFELQSLLLVRIDHLAGNDNAYLWVNPDLGLEPDIANVSAQSLGLFDYSFNRVRPFAGNPQQGAGSEGIIAVDEIRIGDGYADVTPFIPVPEPSTYALLGLATGTFLLWRRRK